MSFDVLIGLGYVIAEAVCGEVDSSYRQWRRSVRRSASADWTRLLDNAKLDVSRAAGCQSETCHWKLDGATARVSLVRVSSDRDYTEMLVTLNSNFPRTTIYWPSTFRDSPLFGDPTSEEDSAGRIMAGSLVCTSAKTSSVDSLVKGVEVLASHVRKPFTIRVTGKAILIRVSEIIANELELGALVQGATELAGAVRRTGELGRSEPVVLQSAITVGRCLVCGNSLGEAPLVRCATCHSMYHSGCWEYVRGCSLFGCRPSTGTDLPHDGCAVVRPDL